MDENKKDSIDSSSNDSLIINKERRIFAINSFRNIGFKNKQPNYEPFNLNYGLNKEYIGDLIILIGPNNSGKSNILDALECFANKNITDRDKNDNFVDDNQLKPSLILKNLIDNKNVAEFLLNTQNLFECTDENGTKIDLPTFNIDNYLNNINASNASKFDTLCNNCVQIFNQYDIDVDYSASGQYINQNGYRQLTYNLQAIKNNLTNIYNKLIDVIQNKNNYPNYDNFMRQILSLPDINNFANNYIDYLKKLIAFPNELKYFPKIIRYHEQNISDKNLSCIPNQLDKNDFFIALLKAIKINPTNILNVYESYKRNNSYSTLESYSDTINEENLASIEKYFNQLYCLDTKKYIFKIRLENANIHFSIFRQEANGKKIGLVLNHQSTGFRWFFDLFFHVFATNDLKPGDIIIMDEPATNLHVKGQEELRKFLKQFAIDNGITFVIATHSPFLVDLDYLDEIRLVYLQDDDIATIKNNFTTVNHEDVDALASIRESLTVRNSILLDPNQIVVFVEGITDYNYLVGMKLLNENCNNITFLPFNGLGKELADKEQRLIELSKIRSTNSMVLIDGDKAGDEFSNLNINKNIKLKIVKLNEIDQSFKEIEDLFTSEDAKKFQVKLKDSGISSIFKKVAIKHPEEISNETKNNFNKIFMKIKELFQ